MFQQCIQFHAINHTPRAVKVFSGFSLLTRISVVAKLINYSRWFFIVVMMIRWIFGSNQAVVICTDIGRGLSGQTRSIFTIIVMISNTTIATRATVVLCDTVLSKLSRLVRGLGRSTMPLRGSELQFSLNLSRGAHSKSWNWWWGIYLKKDISDDILTKYCA